MATTDARTGFRLPWSSDQRTADDESGAAPTEGTPDGDAAPVAQSTEGDTMIEAVDAAVPEATHAGTPAHAGAGAPPSSSRKPSKFLADLTKAMQAAAEAAREEALGRLQADAKTHVEEIHARSSTEAADLRRRADDDVAAIREWSKAEIARIREETETRITNRKAGLETEIEEHAALIERQIERVQSRVAAFEQEMADFFERLLAEDDPTRFAAMAGSLPEPPPFDTDDVAAAAAAAMVAPSAPAEAPAVDAWAFERDEMPAEVVEEAPVEDPEAAMAAIQAAAEAAEAQEGVGEVEPVGETVESDATDPEGTTAEASFEIAEGSVETEAAVDAADPRLAALGASEDFAAAEAEALAAADSSSGDEIEIPTIADEALAARLAGLVPPDGEAPVTAHRTTHVVVTGLVSVASIAGFKRQLGRVAGVQSVGVSSGPDGEFVFAVTHGDEVNLHDAVPTLPGFAARVTGGSDDRIEVSAQDPESEA
jgi:hypothetical protein